MRPMAANIYGFLTGADMHTAWKIVHGAEPSLPFPQAVRW